jgi:putative ABC transport system substrate-binding protein
LASFFAVIAFFPGSWMFIVGGAAASWPLVARGQRAGKVHRIGFLGSTSASAQAHRIEGLRQGLRDVGYIESTNITFEYRWAEGNYQRLPELATDLVRSNVDLIVTHGTPGTLAAKRATATIPIVIAITGDAVATGVVASLARPGESITGQSFFNPELRAKRIEMLKDLMPRLSEVAILINPDNPATVPDLQAIELAAQSLNVKLQRFRVGGPSDLVSAFEKMEEGHVEAVETGDDLVIVTNLGAVAALATRGRLLSVGPKELPQTGGLIGYGVDIFATFRHAAVFVDKILKGAKPADLPIERATKFEFVVNLKTATALGLAIPPSILLRADEVIE